MKRQILAVASAMLALSACDNMANQPRRNPYELPFGAKADWPLQPVPHTFARNAALKPPPAPALTLDLLHRGQQRFDIYCSPCHGRLGLGDGMIVRRGFPPPPSYAIQRLRDAPVAHFYDVITHGYGVMYAYADRVEPADRWAIAAYIRALQASGNATPADVPDDRKGALK